MANTPWKTNDWFVSEWNYAPEVTKDFKFAKNIKVHDITLRDGEQQTGVILTKLDGDARGGAALSIRAVTGKPIKLVGLGEKLDARSKTVPVALVQGDIDQGVKWNPAFQQRTVDIYRDLSLQAAASGPLELVIWPESATPFFFQDGGPLADEVTSVPRRSGVELLFGSPAYRVENRQYRYLDSAFLLSRKGKVLGRSDKIHLVPFGEYVPLKRFLPFVDKLVVGIGDFSPGTVSPLPMDGHKIGVLVCYEAIFPELAREYVRMGSDLLVNITNDAWFGDSSAPYQLLAMARFRAVENRVWLARAANTGISALIAPSGVITVRSSIFKRLALRGRVGLGARPTLYTRTGDLLPVLALILSLWWLVRTRRRFVRT